MWFYTFLAILAGILMPVQAILNSQLAERLLHPLQASFLSFLLGSLTLLILLLFLRLPPTFIFSPQLITSLPPYLLLGGILGAFFVTAALVLINKIGALTMTALFIAGQFLASLLIDHFGLMGIPVNPLTWKRLLGLVFLMLGTLLVKTES